MHLFLILFSLQAEAAVTKSKFLEEFKRGAPGTFCEKSTYFRTCFNITEQDCKKVTVKSVDACVVEQGKDLPENLASAEDGKKWGGKLGECAGARFEIEQKSQKLAKAECSQAEKWK